jgi:site-specific recombinase XerD
MTTKTKTLVKPRQLDQMFRRIVTDAGLPADKVYGVHSLRHTFATLLLRNHTDIKTVSKLMGHNDVNTTYNTYIHVIKEVEAEAINSIPELTSK